MLGSSNARARQVTIVVLLFFILILTLIIMGTVGVNGRITFRSFNSGCLLYMSENNGVPNYKDSYCLMPIIGSAIVAFFTLVFLILHIIIVCRHDEYSPRKFSMLFIFMSGLLALFSFAMCGEIGLGLNKACRLIEDSNGRRHCRSQRNFAALYAAEICAGLMGGFWILVMILEIFQIKRAPRVLGYDAHRDSYGASGYDGGRTTVVPHSASSAPQPHHTEIDMQQPEMTYNPTHAQQHGVDSSSYANQPHLPYSTPAVQGSNNSVAGSQAEPPESSYHHGNSEYHA